MCQFSRWRSAGIGLSHQLNLAILIGAAVILIGAVAVRLSSRLGLPSLLVYLAIGLALGESGLGIRFDDAELTRHLGLGALILIIAEGGLASRWRAVRPALAAGVDPRDLVGVLVSVAVLGVLVHVLLGFDWRLALLYGAVLSSTDAAAVFSTLRRLPLRPRLVAIVEAESGMNDAIVVLLVVLLSAPAPASTGCRSAGGRSSWSAARWSGSRWAVAGGWALRRVALPAAGLYPLAAVGLTVFAYAVGAHRARLRLHRDLRRRDRARQRQAATPAGDPRLRRRPRLARPDRPVRAARAARVAEPD